MSSDLSASRTSDKVSAKQDYAVTQQPLLASEMVGRHQTQPDSNAEEAMTDLLLRYRGPAHSQPRAALPAGPAVQSPSSFECRNAPVSAVHDSGSSQTLETAATRAACSTVQYSEAGLRGSKTSLDPCRAQQALPSCPSQTLGAMSAGASSNVQSSETALRGSDASLNRLKQQHASLRKPKALATDTPTPEPETTDCNKQLMQCTTVHTVSSAHVLQPLTTAAMLRPKEHSSIQTASATEASHSKQSSTKACDVQLGVSQTSLSLASMQRQPVVVPPAARFAVRANVGSPQQPHGSQHQQASQQQLSAEDSDAALLQLLNPSQHSSSKAGRQSHGQDAVQPHTRKSEVTVGNAEEEWGENCSPNVSPGKRAAAHKSKSRQPLTGDNPPASAQTAAVLHSAVSGPAGKTRHEMQGRAPSFSAAEGQNVQQKGQQQSSEKLADIFAFLDDVEAQVGSHSH